MVLMDRSLAAKWPQPVSAGSHVPPQAFDLKRANSGDFSIVTRNGRTVSDREPSSKPQGKQSGPHSSKGRGWPGDQLVE
jgi:hypothetical protein